MTQQPLRTNDYLGHIVDAIDRIFRYIEGVDEAAFLVTPLVQDAVIRNLEIIGEASKNIMLQDGGFAEKHPELPLRMAYAMRNALSHGYGRVDLEVVWRTVMLDLPALHASAKALMTGEG